MIFCIILQESAVVSSMSDLDTPAKGAQSVKRRISAKELCQTALCSGFGKELGNGYCAECLSARGLSGRPKQNTHLSSENLAVVDGASGVLSKVAFEVVPSFQALPDLGPQVESVPVVVSEVVLEDVTKVVEVVPEVISKVALEVVTKVVPSVPVDTFVPQTLFNLGQEVVSQTELSKQYQEIIRTLPSNQFTEGSPPRHDLHSLSGINGAELNSPKEVHRRDFPIFGE
jgi:hypothetical protein